MATDAELHRAQSHPDYEYATTETPATYPTRGDHWTINRARGLNGKEWLGKTEATYWMRPKLQPREPYIPRHHPATFDDLLEAAGIRSGDH